MFNIMFLRNSGDNVKNMGESISISLDGKLEFFLEFLSLHLARLAKNARLKS